MYGVRRGRERAVRCAVVRGVRRGRERAVRCAVVRGVRCTVYGVVGSVLYGVLWCGVRCTAW